MRKVTVYVYLDLHDSYININGDLYPPKRIHYLLADKTHAASHSWRFTFFSVEESMTYETVAIRLRMTHGPDHEFHEVAGKDDLAAASTSCCTLPAQQLLTVGATRSPAGSCCD